MRCSTAPLLAVATLLLFAGQLYWPLLPPSARRPIAVEADWRAPTSAELAAIEQVVTEAEQDEPGPCEDILHDL